MTVLCWPSPQAKRSPEQRWTPVLSCRWPVPGVVSYMCEVRFRPQAMKHLRPGDTANELPLQGGIVNISLVPTWRYASYLLCSCGFLMIDSSFWYPPGFFFFFFSWSVVYLGVGVFCVNRSSIVRCAVYWSAMTCVGVRYVFVLCSEAVCQYLVFSGTNQRCLSCVHSALWRLSVKVEGLGPETVCLQKTRWSFLLLTAAVYTDLSCVLVVLNTSLLCPLQITLN